MHRLIPYEHCEWCQGTGKAPSEKDPAIIEECSCICISEDVVEPFTLQDLYDMRVDEAYNRVKEG
jgi:hypothetical protein